MKASGIVAALAMLALSASACGNERTGTISGHLYRVGGPPPGLPSPMPGAIDVTGQGTGTENTSVRVGPDGFYSVALPAGTYSLAGRSPLIDGGATSCHGSHNVTVQEGVTAEMDVICDIP